MSPALQRHLRRVRRGAWYAVAIVLVVMALVAGIVSQVLLLWAERHPARIEAWLSARAERRVRLAHVQTQVTRTGPLPPPAGTLLRERPDALPLAGAAVLVSSSP